MSEYGIKIGPAGKNVQDCTDEELIFSSEFQAWSIYSEGSGNVDGAGRATIPHSLGYPPVFDIFIDAGSGKYEEVRVGYSTDTNLHIFIDYGIYGTTNYKYKIYTTRII